MRNKIASIVFCCSLLAAPVRADDIGQFVLMKNSSLGRIFMSPAERWQLEQIRLLIPAATNGASGVGREPRPDSARPERHAAGYIIPHSGRPSAWKDGEFRKIDAARGLASLRFVDDFEIIRHIDRPAAAEPTDPDDLKGEGDSVVDGALTAVKTADSVNVQED